MALPSSGSLSLSQFTTEFGGVAPVSLSQYYRGGTRVSNTPPNAAVPTSGVISLSNFYGASAGASFQIQAANITPLDNVDFQNNRGFDSRYGIGAVLNSNLPAPITVYVASQAVVTAQAAPNNKVVELWLAGFSTDPGQAAFVAVSLNGITKLTSNATLYQYFAGVGRGRWAWSAQVDDWGFAAGFTYNGVLA